MDHRRFNVYGRAQDPHKHKLPIAEHLPRLLSCSHNAAGCSRMNGILADAQKLGCRHMMRSSSGYMNGRAYRILSDTLMKHEVHKSAVWSEADILGRSIEQR